MRELGIADFDAYFEALHGQAAFPWQRRLAARVLETGWPSLLDVPTGAGKTAAIDIAIFHLACEALRGSNRRAPMRILFTVDRRIVVDASFHRAKAIAENIGRATDGILRDVRVALESFCAARPLAVVRLRGGLPRDTDWSTSSAQPLVVISTVDQVGSRLLFRGYGVSQRMWPVHAGLVGSDALWLLDEVHLAQPLEETLAAIDLGHEPGGFLSRSRRLAPFAVARLSATPGIDTPKDRFSLNEADRSDETLSARLRASKRMVIDGAYKGDTIEAVTKTALALTRDGNPRRLGIVVNTIRVARGVFDRLRQELGDNASCALLIGRVRELDRERILADARTFFADKDRAAVARPHILVATQTIEAGADLDFDVLVTEIAALDALRQRFGRLNRLGRPIVAEAVLLAPDKSEKSLWETIERIYGESALSTLSWLQTRAEKRAFDFGIDSCDAAIAASDPALVATAIAPKLHAPTLLPAHVRDWAMTWPESSATPQPDIFLHGRRTVQDVSLVWRADITYPATHESEPDRAARLERFITSLEACPPASPELVEIPVHQARRLIARSPQEDRHAMADAVALSDAPVFESDDDSRVGDASWCLRAAAGKDGRTYEWVRASSLRPGDTVVVPATLGGYDDHGWAPAHQGAVRDLGYEANRRQRRLSVLRFTEATLLDAMLAEGTDGSDSIASQATQAWHSIVARVSEADEDADRVIALLLAHDVVPDGWQRLLREMQDPGACASAAVLTMYGTDADPGGGFTLGARLRPEKAPRGGADWAPPEGEAQESTTAEDRSASVGRPVSLRDHSEHVAAFARRDSQKSGLDARLTATVELAAYLHDIGKADARFQADIRGEAVLFALGLLDPLGPEDLLAKSTRHYNPRVPRATPDGFRHEALSVALAKKHPRVADLDRDAIDLAMWLIGTHHGFGRPFFPPRNDTRSDSKTFVTLHGIEVEADATEAPLMLDSGWFELMSRVLRRYGAWELARLEAILRLADHQASKCEADGTIDARVREINVPA
jgi:CRISPR-associated endonuclease/helicase Cas3